MNETEFLEKWNQEKGFYEAWGAFVVENIVAGVCQTGANVDEFFKIPPTHRVKAASSLLDKAFNRGKEYSDPYFDIEDKVGCRFVVLLISQIQSICDFIESSPIWEYDACRHFMADKESQPLLFSYQSVHYILRPKEKTIIDGQNISTSTPCEVQIRTLLQHAHAELTHDAIYKAKKTVEPKVQRTVAKSIALIETADDFFSEATELLNKSRLDDFNVLPELNSIYKSLTGLEPIVEKSSLTIWDSFEQFIDEDLITNIQKVLGKYPNIPDVINKKYPKSVMHRQGSILFVYWLLGFKRTRTTKDWPLDRDILDELASDLCISLDVDI